MADKNDEVLYECDCFRVLKYWDEDGQANVSLSLYNHGIDVYLTEEEFAHLVEVVGGLEHLYTHTTSIRH
ncbi:MAG: hypothetical protein QOD06_742 [Candidatus Binatota bacterium]|jgi:hypothetical protein|nr:hypothetical protein [Candidatus Binatota bacterium]